MKEKIIEFFKEWKAVILGVLLLIAGAILMACCFIAAERLAFLGILGMLISFVMICVAVHILIKEWARRHPVNGRR